MTGVVRRGLIVALVIAGTVAIGPAPAGAAVDTFHFFERNAQANFTVTEECADGSTATLLVTVIGGSEEEQESGGEPQREDFLTVLLRGTDCAGTFINDRGFGTPTTFEFSPSLQTAAVTGTVITREGREVAVDVQWTGEGALETTNNTTIFPGFTGHFHGAERDATATGTVIVDGETIVNGTTANASLETLEDTNITTGAGT